MAPSIAALLTALHLSIFIPEFKPAGGGGRLAITIVTRFLFLSFHSSLGKRPAVQVGRSGSTG